jgi:hypothetical protein
MQPKSSRLFYVNSGPRQIQYSEISCYSVFNIQLNVPPLRLVVYRQNEARYFHICCQMQPKSSRLRCVNTGPSQIQYNYSSSNAGFNIQFNVSPLRLVVYRQNEARYTPYLLTNAA